MKTKKKALLTVVCAALLVTGSVAGTMAYLTSQDVVTNTFTVGNVRIVIDEEIVDEMGVDVNENVSNRTDNNELKLMPGVTYLKDPTIHVDDNSEDCWVFVTVDNKLSGIEASDNTIAAQMTANGWEEVEGYDGIYAHKEVAKAGEDIVVFETFSVAEDADTTKDMNDDGTPDIMATGMTINVNAYAVQKASFDTAKDAWAATFAN